LGSIGLPIRSMPRLNEYMTDVNGSC
jgi:hypothetical protein